MTVMAKTYGIEDAVIQSRGAAGRATATTDDDFALRLYLTKSQSIDYHNIDISQEEIEARGFDRLVVFTGGNDPGDLRGETVAFSSRTGDIQIYHGGAELGFGVTPGYAGPNVRSTGVIEFAMNGAFIKSSGTINDIGTIYHPHVDPSKLRTAPTKVWADWETDTIIFDEEAYVLGSRVDVLRTQADGDRIVEIDFLRLGFDHFMGQARLDLMMGVDNARGALRPDSDPDNLPPVIRVERGETIRQGIEEWVDLMSDGRGDDFFVWG